MRSRSWIQEEVIDEKKRVSQETENTLLEKMKLEDEEDESEERGHEEKKRGTRKMIISCSLEKRRREGNGIS